MQNFRKKSFIRTFIFHILTLGDLRYGLDSSQSLRSKEADKYPFKMDLVHNVFQLTWLRGTVYGVPVYGVLVSASPLELQEWLQYMSYQEVVYNSVLCSRILSLPYFCSDFVVRNVQTLVSNTQQWKWYAQVFQQPV